MGTDHQKQGVLQRLHNTPTVLSGIHFNGIYDEVLKMIKAFWACMFPLQYGEPVAEPDMEEKRGKELQKGLEALIAALKYVEPDEKRIRACADKMLESIPDIFTKLQSDIMAGYEGDPAAKTPDEVVLCYPAFKAVSIYRMAHVLYLAGVPVIPRLMSEYAHAKTGIDIHPGAEIGAHFFIDHGTGVVIGETTVIGNNVKLYQHVTLGAKSFDVNADGSLVKGIKRHPNIGDNVVIYAGATILGGDTTIGSGSVIGGSVWLIHSVPEGSRVYNEASVHTV